MWQATDVENNHFFGCSTSTFCNIFSGRNGGNRTYAYQLEGQMLNNYTTAIAVCAGRGGQHTQAGVCGCVTSATKSAAEFRLADQQRCV